MSLRKKYNNGISLIVLIFIFIFTNGCFPDYNSGINKIHYDESNNLKRAGFWDLNASIYISGDGGWAAVATTEPWCSGSGTWNDPYVIENVTINGQNSSKCIDIFNSNVFFIIRNCTVYNSSTVTYSAGIFLYQVDNGQLIQNNCSSNNRNGIMLRDSNNNTIIQNTANYNGDNGIRLLYSNNNKILENEMIDNVNNGIVLVGGDDNLISQNTAFKNTYGIIISFSNYNNITGNKCYNTSSGGVTAYQECTYNIISENSISNSTQMGIYLSYDSVQNSIFENNISKSKIHGIYLLNNGNNSIINNVINDNDDGIQLTNSDYNEIKDNIIFNNEYEGIQLSNCYNNEIKANCIYDNDIGIQVENGQFNRLIENILVNNTNDGIRLFNQAHNNTIDNNTFENNTNGISINYGDMNVVIENKIGNNLNGLKLSDIDKNKINRNTINNNTQYGIWLTDNSNNNSVSDNLIQNNSIYGIYIEQSDCDKNLFFKNYLLNNSKHSLDLGTNTYWNNSIIGNYWDNYTGSDSDLDGIGDIPHNITLSPLVQDFLPIYEDPFHDGSPILIDDTGPIKQTWQYASTREWCSGSGTFDEPYIIEKLVINGNQSSSCIEIRNSQKFFIIRYCIVFNSTDFISPFFHGGIKLERTMNGTIYDNNCSNNLGGGIELWFSDNNTIIKNAISTSNRGINLLQSHNNTISMNSVSNNNYNGIVVSGSNNITLLLNTISNNTWSHGIVIDNCNRTIISNNKISDNDYRGINLQESNNSTLLANIVSNNSFRGINLYNSDSSVVNNNTISNNLREGIELYENCHNNLIFKNYFINNAGNARDNGTNNRWDNGTIGNYWDDYPGYDLDDDGIGDDPYNISGSAGSKDYLPIWDDGDSITPSIIISSPNDNDIFEESPPSFTVVITDLNLDTMWYTLDDGLTNTTFSTNETIDQTIWDSFGSGNIGIGFYANDTARNIGFTEVIVIKDIDFQHIAIISPTDNETFGTNAPSFIVEIFDQNIEMMWYTLDGGLTNTTFSMNESINQILWDSFGSGDVTIEFYSNDTLGHIGYASVTVEKDIDAPIITIHNPTQNELFGTLSPQFFNISIIESNLDDMWYTLDNGITNISINDISGAIEQTEWENLGTGSIIIIFYGNDTLGHIGNASVNIEKDIDVPIITINNPSQNQIFGAIPPIFNISITELHLDEIWYTINGGTTKYMITTTSDFINQTIWDSLADGTITIRFYANDEVGNEAYAEVFIDKDTTVTSEGPDMLLIVIIISIVGGISVVAVVLYLLMRKRKLSTRQLET